MTDIAEETLESVALDNMPPRELIRGLMRGHEPDFKVGYSADAAIGAVETIHGEEIAESLRDYAEGFADGMAEPDTKLPETRD